MKKIVLLAIISILISFPLFAEKTNEVSLRSSKQDSSIRIVMESNDDMIKNANIITSFTSVTIEFPFQFVLIKQKDFLFETTKKDTVL